MMKKLVHSLRMKRELRKLADLPAWQVRIVERVLPFTMTGIERVVATIGAVEYIVSANVPGSIVECGVWRGGQMMAAAMTLLHLKAERELLLFDTYEGMTQPDEVDRDMDGQAASKFFDQAVSRAVGERWCEARLAEVQQNMHSTGYADTLVKYVVGPVEHTLPDASPDAIAYLRLDTDWYASTMHEFDHLFPLVSPQGIVSIDDYGHWEGARKATDEYLARHGVHVLLHRIDYSGRQFVKP